MWEQDAHPVCSVKVPHFVRPPGAVPREFRVVRERKASVNAKKPQNVVTDSNPGEPMVTPVC